MWFLIASIIFALGMGLLVGSYATVGAAWGAALFVLGFILLMGIMLGYLEGN
jgi:hypothetical protein